MTFCPGEQVTVVNGAYAWNREKMERTFIGPDRIGKVLEATHVCFMDVGNVAVVAIQFGEYRAHVAPGRVRRVEKV